MFRFLASPRLHGLAILLGALLYFVLRSVSVSSLTGCFNERSLYEYSTNWPGLENIEKHSIFNPLYAQSKKIVMLGGSNTEAMGCDKTWSRKIPGQERNAHLKCSTSGLLEEILHKEGFHDWKVFNMGRNNGNILNAISTYIRLYSLRPEIVILGADGWIFRAPEEKPAFPDVAAILDPDKKNDDLQLVFNETVSNLKERLPDLRVTPVAQKLGPVDPVVCKDHVTLVDVLSRFLLNIRRAWTEDYPLRVPEIFTYPFLGKNLTEYSVENDLQKKSVRVETVEALPLLQSLVTHNGGKFFVYQPYSHTRSYKYEDWKKHFENDFLRVINENKVPYFDMLHLPLKTRLEDYDAVHLTLYGDRRVAQKIFEYLSENKELG